MSLKEDNRDEVRTIFDCVPPSGGAISAAIIADILANGLDAVQIAVLGTFITTVGDALAYISAQMVLNGQITERKNPQPNSRNINGT